MLQGWNTGVKLELVQKQILCSLQIWKGLYSTGSVCWLNSWLFVLGYLAEKLTQTLQRERDTPYFMISLENKTIHKPDFCAY